MSDHNGRRILGAEVIQRFYVDSEKTTAARLQAVQRGCEVEARIDQQNENRCESRMRDQPAHNFAGVATIDQVRGFDSALAGFSAELAAEERQLKRLLYERLYNSPALIPVREEAERVISGLAQYYLDNPADLPAGWQRGEGELARQRGIADYIAGMTDRFAIARHEELVGPVHLPDRF